MKQLVHEESGSFDSQKRSLVDFKTPAFIVVACRKIYGGGTENWIKHVSVRCGSTDFLLSDD